jgi:hypothetical protein
MISTIKDMVYIFWSALGFSAISALPPRSKFTAADFWNDIIPKIVEGITFDLANSSRQLPPHMDNATQHRAWESITCLKKFRIRPTDHMPYSPDSVSPDFYLFGKLKNALAGQEFESAYGFLLAIRGSVDRSGGPNSSWSLTPENGD